MRRSNRQSPIDNLDQAVHLLCNTAPLTLPAYYIGSMPFVLGLLYFIGDMSRNSYAGEHCAVASLGLALLYVWMKCWQARFAALLLTRIAGRTDPPPTLQRLFTLIARQAIIQATGFFILPAAALLVLPLGWCYAFYQNATALGFDSQATLMDDWRRAWQQALLWPRQNHLVLSIMSLFGIVVYANIAITVYMLPHAIKRFGGIETVFTLSGAGLFNTTFLAVTAGLTYLCLDPILKTAYALRCYYGEAIKSGTDLKAQLAYIKRLPSVIVAGLVMGLLFLPVEPAAATVSNPPSREATGQGQPVSAAELDRTIEHVLQKREFAWRLPRHIKESEKKENRGPLASALEWMVDKIADGGRWVWRQLERFAEWINRMMPDQPTHRSNRSSGSGISASTLMTILLILIAGIAIVFVVKNWNRRNAIDDAEPNAGVTFEPDLTDESLKADSLPLQGWLELALKLHKEGSFRLAIRALYLATLSHLADNEYISIQIYKSNREYLRELSRRTAGQPDLKLQFKKMVTVFERIWYGRYPASEQDYNRYAAIQQSLVGGSDAC